MEGEELYNYAEDPDMICKLAASPDHLQIKERLKKLLEMYLINTGDPRAAGLSTWDEYRLDK